MPILVIFWITDCLEFIINILHLEIWSGRDLCFEKTVFQKKKNNLTWTWPNTQTRKGIDSHWLPCGTVDQTATTATTDDLFLSSF